MAVDAAKEGRAEKVVQLVKALRAWEEKRRAVVTSIGRGSAAAGPFMAAMDYSTGGVDAVSALKFLLTFYSTSSLAIRLLIRLNLTLSYAPPFLFLHSHPEPKVPQTLSLRSFFSSIANYLSWNLQTPS